MSKIAVSCIDDVMTKLETVPLVASKVFHVYSETDLMDEAKFIKKPAVGIFYEGIQAVPDGTGLGLSADLRLALAVIIESKDIANLDRKDAAIELLDGMRTALKLTKAPGGYPWRFLMEAPVGVLGNNLAYVQRWSTRVILTSG